MVFLAGKDSSQVLDGFLDIVADFDLTIHAYKRYSGSNSGGLTVARAISPSNIEAATPSAPETVRPSCHSRT